MTLSRRHVVGSAIVGALVVCTGVAAAVIPDRGGGRREVGVVARSDDTDNSIITTTAAGSTTSTEPDIMNAPADVQPDQTIVPRPAQPDDLAGAIALGSTMVHLRQSTPIVLTVTNMSDHAVSILDPSDGRSGLELWLDSGREGGDDEVDFDEAVPVLAPGQSHTFTQSLWPDTFVGAVRFVARMHLVGDCSDPSECTRDEDLRGVPPVDVEIVPPGWSPDMPLDPTQARWQARMSADSAQVADDGTVVIHASIRNLSDEVATTGGYGSLAIMCQSASIGTATEVDHVVNRLTLAPGATGTFASTLDLRDAEAHGVWLANSLTRVQCSVGMKYDEQDDPYNFPAWTDPAIVSDTVVITVTHQTPTSTTGASAGA